MYVFRNGLDSQFALTLERERERERDRERERERELNFPRYFTHTFMLDARNIYFILILYSYFISNCS
jgi:hypothetical protein